MKAVWAALRACTLVSACTLTLGTALGQATNSGDLRGTVTDSTGALIPGVTVTVTNVNTGVTKVLKTNRDGLYDTSSIVVGTYSVTFEKQGFAKFERSAITLQVGTSTVNASMKVGSTTEEVVVNTDIPLLNTESGSQSTTLEANSMQILPNVGQDWQNFAILIPGTSGTAQGNQGATNPGDQVSANGALPYSNVLSDGASTTLSTSGNSDVNIFETVAEVQVSTSAFSAQYGIGGIIFNQISKGGTNKFHGSLYDYFQSSEFEAHPYVFKNLTGGTVTPVPYLRYNNFGGSIGGPVLIPKVFNGRDKAFFFFDYDQTVNHGSSSNAFNSIPTAQTMSGDFTGQSLIYDPTTQTIAHDSKGNPYPVRRSFLSEYGTNAIPASMLSKVATNFQKFYPTPANHLPGGEFVTGTVNSQGILQNNFYSSVPASSPERRYFGRFDYNITQNNRLTISVTQRDIPAVTPNGVTACPIQCGNQDIESYNPQVTDVWSSKSGRFINEVRFGYSYQGNFFGDQTFGLNYPQQLGWQFAKANEIPGFQFVTNYPYAWIEPNSSQFIYKEHTFDPSDVVTMIRGKHVLHFGGEFQIYRNDNTPYGYINPGTMQFSGQYTQQWTVTNGVASPNSATGVDYADFLLGDAENWSAQVQPEYGARLKSPQMFIQDDYKVLPNLTLNLGLRYEIRRGFTEVHGNESTYDPTVNNPATNTLGAFWYGTTAANGRNALEAPNYTTFLPRVGFSWLPNPTMTVRGGFGIYAYNLSLDTYGGGMGTALGSSGNASDQTNGITPLVNIDSTGSNLPYPPFSTSPSRFNGQSVSYTQYKVPTPEIYEYNFDIQQAIGTNMVFELAYVGSHGFNLNFPVDINQVPVGEFSSNDSALVPNPNYQQINGSTNNAISNYNSMQATVSRRLASGLSFNFNYVWSHFLDDIDSSAFGSHSGQNFYQYTTPALNYSNSNFDVRNAFKGNAVYEIPVGVGRKYLNRNNWLDPFVGGYELSGTVQLTSGNPFTIYSGAANSYAQPGNSNATVFPNYTGISTRPIGGRSINEWFNPAAFSLPANGTFGDVRRNSLYGPGIELVNLSVGKKFTLHDQIKLQLRMDATNALNHPSFGVPSQELTTSGGPGTAYGVGGNNAIITGLQENGRFLQFGARLQY